MAEVSRLCFPEMDTELEICDEKARQEIGRQAGTAVVALPASGWSQYQNFLATFYILH